MDVSQLCRSCMEEVAPWEREDADQNTVAMFSFCTNIEISKEDELPKHFCFNCTVLIESSYTYIRKARRVNGKLKKLIQNGSTTFVDNFLSKNNCFDIENNDEKPIEIVTAQTDDKNDDHSLDHDSFDDDDDICLSNFKSDNSNKIKVEPINYLDELSNGSLKSKASAQEVKNELDNSKEISENRCNICKKNFASKGWHARHMKTVHCKRGRKKRKVPELEGEQIINGDAKIKKIKKKKTVCADKTENKDRTDQSSIEEREIKTTEDVNDNEIENAEQASEKNNKINEENMPGSPTDSTKDTDPPKSPKKKNSKEQMQCKLCSKEFASIYLRNMHVHNDHSKVIEGSRVFACPHCPKTFTKYSVMYYHTTKHNEVRKHICSTCGKQYRIAKELHQHILTHNKDRPYACDKCHMKFKIKGILANHVKWHEGVRPYLCNVCGHSFMQSGNLESHMRVHTGERPFPCSICPFRSGSKGGLKRHELRHRGERPYPCELCPKRFYESCSLSRHVRSHTRERPYKCPYCTRCYYDSGKRRRHLINTHKMAPGEIPPMDKDGRPINRHDGYVGKNTRNYKEDISEKVSDTKISSGTDICAVNKEMQQ